MNFKDAMIMLEAGAKVSRPSFEGCYYMMVDGAIITRAPSLSYFIFDESIMISDGWIIEDEEGEFKFYEIIHALKQGKKVKMRSWDEKFIYLKKDEGLLISQKYDLQSQPDFESFLADDWIIVS